MNKYIPTIGLEIHAELMTKSKMFCGCANYDENIAIGDKQYANTRICPVCMGMPGVLPYPNKKAVEMTLKVGKALNCQISKSSKWDRKNYFYPDLPKGYQISQYDLPLTTDGKLELKANSSQLTAIRIRRVHLEEDTGKLLHPWGVGVSWVDYNRAGVPLLELVTEPDITSAEQARAFAQEIQLILRHLGVSNADMEKGEMRVEANISISHIANGKSLGTKVEIKNLNSFRSVEKALKYEIERQTKAHEAGEKIIQETRGWSDKENKTFSQRTKETSADYRYFPEPDIPPLQGLDKWEIKKVMTHHEKATELAEKYHLPEKYVKILSTKPSALSVYLDPLEKNNEKNPEVLKEYNNLFFNIAKEKNPYDIYGLAKKIASGELSKHQAKQMLKGEKGVSGRKGVGGLAEIIDEILKKNPKAVQEYKSGKKQAMQFLFGQIMYQTKGRAEPIEARKLLMEKING